MRRSLSRAVLGLFLLAVPLSAQAPPADGPSLQAFLFGDVLFMVSDRDVDDGFQLGQMVAHGNATLSQNLVFFGEVSVTARDAGYSLAMERAILRYEFNDAVKVSAGRYHTPVSYWNTQYHHGLWLQGSVARPEAVKFGSRYVPVHFVGAMLEGNLAQVPVQYSVGVGNGRARNIAGAGDAGDVNGQRAVLAAVSVRPERLEGLQLGGSVYFDRLADDGGSYADERILSGHAVFDRGPWEVIGEYFHVRHEALDSDAEESSPSFYLHAGYRLPGRLRALTPYARYEEMDIAAGDLVYSGAVDDYEAAVVGLRYDFEGLAALKAEYRNETFGTAPRTDSYFLQASFAIPVAGS